MYNTHSHTYTYTHSLIPILNTLLDKSEAVVRLAVGQAVALLFELARESNEELVDSNDAGVTYSFIEHLATDSNRYTARKDRNQQRALFRDVLQTLDVSRTNVSYASTLFMKHFTLSPSLLRMAVSQRGQ